MRTSLPEWLGIRGLDLAVALAVLSGAMALCWTLPPASIPIEAFGHLGSAQKVSVLFFAISSVGVAGAVCVALIVHKVGRQRLVAIGIAISILSEMTAVFTTHREVAQLARRVSSQSC